MPEWRWFDSTFEALARGEVNLAAGGTASLCRGEDGSDALSDPAPIALPGVSVVRVGADTGWVFGDLQWGPDVTAENVRSVLVSAGGRGVAYLPLDKSYDVVRGVFTVIVPSGPVLMLGNGR